jgi:hypothetical protein
MLLIFSAHGSQECNMTIKILNHDLAFNASAIGEILPTQQAINKCNVQN